MKSARILFPLVLLTLCACEGKEGPVGLTGPPGPGTIVVYEGEVPVQNEIFTVSTPAIDADDLPLVVIYVRDIADDWLQLNVVETENNFVEMAVIHDGSVEILTTLGVRYRIIVILE